MTCNEMGQNVSEANGSDSQANAVLLGTISVYLSPVQDPDAFEHV